MKKGSGIAVRHNVTLHQSVPTVEIGEPLIFFSNSVISVA